jgi:inhibitor of the pro-sigma K processing machinery
MDYQLIAAYAFGVIILLVVARMVYTPMRFLLRLAINAVVGGLLLIIFNYAGDFFSLHIPMNPVTVLLTGILGIPGVILLVITRYIIL